MPLPLLFRNRSSRLLLATTVLSGFALGSSITSVTTAAGTNACSQTGSDTASCTSTTSGPNGPETSSALAAATWLSPTGSLEAITHANGPLAKASASVSFSAFLIVTGVTGSGNLDVQFSGFQDTSGGNQPGTVSPVSIMIGTSSQSVTLANGAPAPFTATAPVNFGVLIPFTVSFTDSAAGSMFNNGTYISEDADALLLAPTFVVTNSSGGVLPGASVQVAPEPGTLALFIAAVPLLLSFIRKRPATGRAV